MGIEPTNRHSRGSPTGFEDQACHQTRSTSTGGLYHQLKNRLPLGRNFISQIYFFHLKMNRVAKTLEGKVFFITGATGFLGQPLVEKILYSSPSIKRLYLLIRPKNQLTGQTLSASDRLQKELFPSSVFDRLYNQLGKKTEAFLEEKLVAVEGDIAKENFGFNATLLNQLQNDIDIVINSAAVVSFDAPLDDALQFNILSAARAARFAQKCGAALIHISTAYVSGVQQGIIPETVCQAISPPEGGTRHPFGKFGDVEREINHLASLIEQVHREAHSAEVDRELKEALLKQFRKSRRGGKKARRRDKIENLRKKWIKNRLTEEGLVWARTRGWNDTYTYTKALAEQVVLRNRGEIPTVIIRPSVIESSLSEPNPGWLDGLRMADPLIVAIGKGRLHSLPMDGSVTLDLIPVDMVVNAVLASIPRMLKERGVRIYHVATGDKNPITLASLYELIYDYFQRNPMLDRKGRPVRVKPLKFPKPLIFHLQQRLRITPLRVVEKVLERLPFRSLGRLQRQVSTMRAAYEKLYYYGEIYQPYLNLACRFEVTHTLELFNSLEGEEKRVFNFDITQLNWRHYIQNVHIPGVKKHVLKKEGAGTLEVAEAIPAEPLTINKLLELSAAKFPNKTALQIKRDGQWQRYTYKELKDASAEIGRKFLQMGMRKGHRVVLYSENQPEWGAAYLGASSLGVVVVPLDAQTRPQEVWSVAQFTGARALLVSEHCFGRLSAEGLRQNKESVQPVKILNVNRLCTPFTDPDYSGSTGIGCRPSQVLKAEEVAPDDLASIIFTTSTEVDPRGAMHTHRSFITNLFGANHYLAVAETDQLLSVLPLYHALEFTCGFLMAIYGGATVTYVHSLKPRVILETMRETGTTCMLGVPTLYALIRDDIERRILKTSKSALTLNLFSTSKHLIRSMERTFGKNIGRQLFARVHQEFGGRIRVFVSGGSALGEELYEDFRALGMPIYEGYGLTETAPVLTVNPLNRSRKGSAGKPLPGVELRIFNSNREGVGEIIVQTPSLMKGYYRNPEATKSVIRDGWFHTGDLGWVDADGYTYITGRIKDVIVTGAGKNVYPADLEAIYRVVPAVREICVVGIKSGLTEDIHAVVVPDAEICGEGEPAAAKKRIQGEIQKIARELPSYQRLQQLHVWTDPLPRGDSGEIRRDLVKRILEQRLEADRARPRQEAATLKEGTDYERELVRELSRLSGVPAQEITPDSHLYSDLGLDSLMAIELLLFMEHRFGISISDQAAGRLETVGQLLHEMQRLLAAGARPPEVRPAARLGKRKARIRSALPYTERPPVSRYLQSLSCSGLETLYRTYFDLELANSEYLPKDGAYIIATNHASHLDAGAIISALSAAQGVKQAQKLHVLGAKDYFFDTPLKSWFFSTFLNVVPVEREEASLAGLRMVKSILSCGEPLLIFPEGTRSRTGQLQEFKPGLGLIALELGVPVIPAYIQGAHEAMPAGKLFPRRRQLRVIFGAPIRGDAYRHPGSGQPKDEIYRRIAADVRNAILTLSNGTLNSTVPSAED